MHRPRQNSIGPDEKQPSIGGHSNYLRETNGYLFRRDSEIRIGAIPKPAVDQMV